MSIRAVYTKLDQSRYDFHKCFLEDGKSDPVFYCDGYGHTFVASITDKKTGLTLEFYCDGDMDIRHPDFRARYSSELDIIGVHSDKDLSKIEPEWWVNNPWFDIYEVLPNGETQPLDMVHFDIQEEGIPYAILYMATKETSTNG
jgi:hypothetical protein